jgi:transcriptional regulator with XRE-family HTH domain
MTSTQESRALSVERRKEIATFLRIRRARRQPEHVGLPRNGRRRTPGLRREEVAALAGLSTEWYTWLEQAREVHPSAETLRRVGLALRLEPGEAQHLLTLAGYGFRSDETRPGSLAVIGPRLQRLMDQLEYCPAWVMGERWDILAWNQAARIVWGDLGAMKGIERNVLYQLFLNPRTRGMLVSWMLHAQDCVAKVRAVYARNVDDPWFNELVHLLCDRSREFAKWWDDHDVQIKQYGVKYYDHPEAGRLAFDYTALDVTDEGLASLRLVTYVPAPGTDTQKKIAGLLQHTASEPLIPALAD